MNKLLSDEIKEQRDERRPFVVLGYMMFVLSLGLLIWYIIAITPTIKEIFKSKDAATAAIALYGMKDWLVLWSSYATVFVDVIAVFAFGFESSKCKTIGDVSRMKCLRVFLFISIAILVCHIVLPTTIAFQLWG